MDKHTIKYAIEDKRMKQKKPIPQCSSCGCRVFFNLHIYKETGMCGACTTGEARLNYEEDEDEDE